MRGPRPTPQEACGVAFSLLPSHFSLKKRNPGSRSTPGWSGRTTPPSNAAHGHNLCQRASGFRTDPARQVDRGFQIVTPTLAAGHHCNQPWRCCFLRRGSPLCPPHPNTRDYLHLILSAQLILCSCVHSVRCIRCRDGCTPSYRIRRSLPKRDVASESAAVRRRKTSLVLAAP